LNRVVYKLSCFFLIGVAYASGADVPIESRVRKLWNYARAGSTNHIEILSACAHFERDPSAASFFPVSRGIAAWAETSEGRLERARKLWGRLSTSGSSAMANSANEMSRRWQTRLDRENIKAALQRYYLREIEYPRRLKKLQDTEGDFAIELLDRWQRPWVYRAQTPEHLPGALQQTYLLDSERMGDKSDLGAALGPRYGGDFQLRVKQLRTLEAGNKEVTLYDEALDLDVVLTQRFGSGQLELTYVGTTIVIVSSGDHWIVVSE